MINDSHNYEPEPLFHFQLPETDRDPRDDGRPRIGPALSRISGGAGPDPSAFDRTADRADHVVLRVRRIPLHKRCKEVYPPAWNFRRDLTFCLLFRVRHQSEPV